MDNPREMFATRLTLIRESNNLTMGKLAKRLGISLSSLSGYEHQDRFPSIETLIKIALYFNVSLDWFLGIENRVPREYITINKMSIKEADTILKSLNKIKQIVVSNTLK